MEHVIGLPGDDLGDTVVVDVPDPPRCTCPPVFRPTTEHLEGCPVRAYYGSTDCRGEPLELGPATRADLDDLDAVPEPVDSAAPAVTYLPGAAPIGPTAETRPYRVPRRRTATSPSGQHVIPVEDDGTRWDQEP